jgi:hypothetical protein
MWALAWSRSLGGRATRRSRGRAPGLCARADRESAAAPRCSVAPGSRAWPAVPANRLSAFPEGPPALTGPVVAAAPGADSPWALDSPADSPWALDSPAASPLAVDSRRGLQRARRRPRRVHRARSSHRPGGLGRDPAEWQGCRWAPRRPSRRGRSRSACARARAACAPAHPASLPRPGPRRKRSGRDLMRGIRERRPMPHR